MGRINRLPRGSTSHSYLETKGKFKTIVSEKNQSSVPVTQPLKLKEKSICEYHNDSYLNNIESSQSTINEKIDEAFKFNGVNNNLYKAYKNTALNLINNEISALLKHLKGCENSPFLNQDQINAIKNRIEDLRKQKQVWEYSSTIDVSRKSPVFKQAVQPIPKKLKQQAEPNLFNQTKGKLKRNTDYWGGIAQKYIVAPVARAAHNLPGWVDYWNSEIALWGLENGVNFNSLPNLQKPVSMYELPKIIIEPVLIGI